MARRDGYKPGWVAVNFKKKFGRWPPPPFSALPGLRPRPATRNWLRQQDWISMHRDAVSR